MVQDESKETQGMNQTRGTFNIGEKLLIKVKARTEDNDRYEGPYEVIEKYTTDCVQDKNRKASQRNGEKMR